ncbi:MAG: phage holin family protein [Clostridia bacterium]|nr:phage holin family protein [Clostridia bacterium]
MEKLKYAVAMFGGIILGYLEKYRFLYLMVGAAVLLDLISGMAAAVIQGQGLSSSVARAGFFKKLMLLFSVGFGTFLDVLLPWCGEMVGLELRGKLMFSAVICVYICVGESISVLENIFRSTGTKLPGWITKLLKEAKDKMENE